MTQKLIESLVANTEGQRRRHPGLLRQEQGAVLPEGRQEGEPHPLQARGQGDRREGPRELQDGGSTSPPLAKKYSIDTATASKGGDLGWPTTAYVPEFQAALDKLKKGQTTAELVQTPVRLAHHPGDRRACRHAAAAGRGQVADRADHRAAAQGRRVPDSSSTTCARTPRSRYFEADLKAAAAKGSKPPPATK